MSLSKEVKKTESSDGSLHIIAQSLREFHTEDDRLRVRHIHNDYASSSYAFLWRSHRIVRYDGHDYIPDYISENAQIHNLEKNASYSGRIYGSFHFMHFFRVENGGPPAQAHYGGSPDIDQSVFCIFQQENQAAAYTSCADRDWYPQWRNGRFFRNARPSCCPVFHIFRTGQGTLYSHVPVLFLYRQSAYDIGKGSQRFCHCYSLDGLSVWTGRSPYRDNDRGLCLQVPFWQSVALSGLCLYRNQRCSGPVYRLIFRYNERLVVPSSDCVLNITKFAVS